jgi:hypothetical protein
MSDTYDAIFDYCFKKKSGRIEGRGDMKWKGRGI